MFGRNWQILLFQYNLSGFMYNVNPQVYNLSMQIQENDLQHLHVSLQVTSPILRLRLLRLSLYTAVH